MVRVSLASPFISPFWLTIYFDRATLTDFVHRRLKFIFRHASRVQRRKFLHGCCPAWMITPPPSKPYSLSDQIEVMPGIGPAWIYKTGRDGTTNSLGAVALIDFQIWPTRERNFGWFIKPSYGYDFGREHEQSLGVTFGLLIPIR
jgi:hypothetical protein